MNHLLSIEQLSAEDIRGLIETALTLKEERWQEAVRSLHGSRPLEGQTWAMIFSKASTRTRVSFEVGISELGGRPMFLSAHDIQLGRGEPIKDTARVLGRMVHGAVIRTFEQKDVEDFADYSGIPTINALTDDEHPCQILADLMTIREVLGGWEQKKIVFVGDGFNNMARSWMWAAKRLGFSLYIAGPREYLPPAEFLQKLDAPNVICTTDVQEAVKDADVINTDVWLSMGQEEEGESKERHFLPYQLNEALLSAAHPGHIVLHCLPAYRGKEITEETLEKFSSVIFREAENRLHAQKAVLVKLAAAKVIL